MLKSVMAAVSGALRLQSFEDYYSALVARAPEVAPKAQEARQDYLPRVQAQAALHPVWM